MAQDGADAFVASPRYAVSAYRLTYLTMDAAGQQILASALVTVPQKPANAPSPVLSYQHGTIQHEAEAPSYLTDKASPEVVLASLGYIVQSADYVGYGASKGASHPYLLSAPSAAAVMDLLTAAKYWRQTQGVPDNQQLFLAGYSEGGYVTMATHRALQQGSSADRQQIVSVVPGAGPYDVGLTLDTLLGIVRQQYPAIGNLLQPGILKYLSASDRYNVRDAVLKQVQGAGSDVTFTPNFLDNYFADDRTAIEQQSDVNNWLPQKPVFLFHGQNDLTVPYLNSSTTLTLMQNKGAGNLVTLTDCQAQPAGHSDCVLPYWKFLLDTLGKAARDL
jgi:pimeloyl-ACP methyl ester carboxylesterase